MTHRLRMLHERVFPNLAFTDPVAMVQDPAGSRPTGQPQLLFQIRQSLPWRAPHPMRCHAGKRRRLPRFKAFVATLK